MWRLNSYWRFKQEADAVIVECESISVSRGIPIALGWLVKPFVMSVPRESLESTLGSLRRIDPTPGARTPPSSTKGT